MVRNTPLDSNIILKFIPHTKRTNTIILRENKRRKVAKGESAKWCKSKPLDHLGDDCVLLEYVVSDSSIQDMTW